MDVTRYYKHQASIDDISKRYRAFAHLKNARISAGSKLKWIDEDDGAISYHALTAFIGKTGYGKSSTVDAFLGSPAIAARDPRARARQCRRVDFELSQQCYFSLGDMPGIGESERADSQYLSMYRDFLEYSTAVVYVIRSDTRDYSLDREAYRQLFDTYADRKKVIFALNCCDPIAPYGTGPAVPPDAAQMRNIHRSIDRVNCELEPLNSVVPYNAANGWNMGLLAGAIVKVVRGCEQVMLDDW